MARRLNVDEFNRIINKINAMKKSEIAGEIAKAGQIAVAGGMAVADEMIVSDEMVIACGIAVADETANESAGKTADEIAARSGT